jgi:hypothetical protein
MGLPTIDVPTFKVKVESLGKNYKFRPFLVKEEKILVMASESSDKNDMLHAAQQVITNCSFDKVDGEKLPMFEVQKLFLTLRSQSVGNVIELNAKCGDCGESSEVFLDIDEVDIVRDDSHTNKIQLSDEIYIEMTYPSVEEVAALTRAEEDVDIYIVAANSISKIFTTEEAIDFQSSPPDERIDWIENLSPNQFGKIKNFFETMPQLYHTIEFKCKECKKDNYLVIDGYENFFV